MKNLSFLCLTATAFFSSSSALAYPASVSLRSFNEKKPDDDMVVIDIPVIDTNNDVWYRSPGPEVFEIRRTPYSIELVRSVDKTPGFRDNSAHFSCLDRLHDVPGSGINEKLSMRIYFTENFFWVESWQYNLPNSRVRSGLMFIGPSQKTYKYYLQNIIKNVRYGKLSDFKLSVQNNYSSKYTYNGGGEFLFTRKGWNALIANNNFSQ